MQSTRPQQFVRYDFADLQNMIHAHLEYLLKHKEYLIKIKLPEAYGGISVAEKNEYLKDIVGFLPDKSQLTEKDYFNHIHYTLKLSIVVFEELSKICAKDNETNRMLLYFMLEFCHEHSKFQAKVRESNQFSIYDENILKTLFAEDEQLHFLKKHAKKILPEIYPKIAKALFIEVQQIAYNSPSSGNKKTGVRESYVTIFTHLNRLLSDYYPEENALEQNKNDMFGDEHEVQFLKDNLKKLKIVASYGSDELRALKDPEGPGDTQAILNAHFEFNEKITVMLALIKGYEVIRNTMKNHENREKDFKKSCHEAKTQLQKFRKTLKAIVIPKEVKAVRQDVTVKQELKQVTELKSTVLTMLQASESLYKNKLQNKNYLDPEANTYIDELNIRNNAIKTHLKEIKDKLRALKNEVLNQKKPKAHAQPKEAHVAEKAELKQFQQKKQEINAEYKARVEAARNKKQEIKNTTLFQNGKAVQSKVVNESNGTALSVSENMLQRLQSLKQKDLLFLQRILEEQAGVKFSEVTQFIINKLGGTVTEIGNGSSHKRFQIEKLYFEASSKNEDADKKQQTLATGGFYRPHGKAHSAGYMSSFNLRLIATGLQKAGISLDLIKQLEQTLDVITPKYKA